MLRGFDKSSIIILALFSVLIVILGIIYINSLGLSDKNQFLINMFSNLASNFFTALFITLFFYAQSHKGKKKRNK